MTAPEDVPAVVRRMADTTNSGDTEGFVGCFTPDAVLIDWGRTYEGEAGIRAWNESDNVGQGNVFRFVQSQPDADGWTLRFDAASRRRSGPGTMRIRLRDGLIERLVISA